MVDLLKAVQYIIWPWTATYDFATGGLEDVEKQLEVTSPPAPGASPTTVQTLAARKQLATLTAAMVGVVAAPAIYAAYLGSSKKRKKKLTDKQIIQGKAIENASAQATGVLMTAIAAPAIAAASAYILVQKLEDGRLITKGLGDAAQALLAVAAAGPAIQGVGQIAGSAFTKAK